MAAAQLNWRRPGPPLPLLLASLALLLACASAQRLYAIGGSSGTFLNLARPTAEQFNMLTNTWRCACCALLRGSRLPSAAVCCLLYLHTVQRVCEVEGCRLRLQRLQAVLSVCAHG